MNEMQIKKFDWFFSEDFDKGRVAKLDKEELRHLKVKRDKKGDSVCVFDGKGRVGLGIIDNKGAVFIEQIFNFEDKDFLTIAVAVPKGKRVDLLIAKLTELGVSKIIPMKTEYSVVEPSLNKQERWKRLLIESCKQCKRPCIPQIEKYTTFSEVIKMKYDFKIILDMDGEAISHFDFAIPDNVLAIIGPEGGFSADEIIAASDGVFKRVKINDDILRVETAAIALGSIVMSRKITSPPAENPSYY